MDTRLGDSMFDEEVFHMRAQEQGGSKTARLSVLALSIALACAVVLAPTTAFATDDAIQLDGGDGGVVTLDTPTVTIGEDSGGMGDQVDAVLGDEGVRLGTGATQSDESSDDPDYDDPDYEDPDYEEDDSDYDDSEDEDEDWDDSDYDDESWDDEDWDDYNGTSTGVASSTGALPSTLTRTTSPTTMTTTTPTQTTQPTTSTTSTTTAATPPSGDVTTAWWIPCLVASAAAIAWGVTTRRSSRD